MAALTRLTALQTETETEPTPSPTTSTPSSETDRLSVSAWSMVALGLKVLSTRAIALAGHATHLLGLALAFLLWMSVMPDPTTHQLVGLGLFGAMVLSLIWLKR